MEPQELINRLLVNSRSSSLVSGPVPCYTCRRRHVRCDGGIPSCAKCEKGKVICLGYRKPLKWVGGVAIRGKKRALSQTSNNRQKENLANNPKKESEYFGLHKTPNIYCDVAPVMSTFLEIVKYYNAIACIENEAELSLINRHMVSLSADNIQCIPKVVLNIIVAVASVHLFSSHRNIMEFHRLALETKAGAYESFNTLLKAPNVQVSDLTYCCALLIFAVDIIENGLDNWRMHHTGAGQIIVALGGVEKVLFDYPYLWLPLFHFSQFETYSVVSSFTSLRQPKITSKHALLSLLHGLGPKSRVSNPCPRPLTQVLWELGATASTLYGDAPPLFDRATYTREQILFKALKFEPSDWVKELQKEYVEIRKPENAKLCLLVTNAWKSSLIILILRYLFFGRMSSIIERVESSIKTESNLHETKYALHNDAFNTLVANISLFPTGPLACNLRFVLIPIIILALVSTPSSPERALCISLFTEFANHFAIPIPAPTRLTPELDTSIPESHSELRIDIPWSKLDAFSSNAKRNLLDSKPTGQLTCGAVEWNWWDMLLELELDLAWPCTAGTSHLERGIDFWALKLISSVITEESFDNWAKNK